MKKLLLSVMLLVPSIGLAQEQMIVATLLDHVMPVTQIKESETKLALVDSVITIGHYNEQSLLHVQVGFNSETKPDSGEVTGASLIAGLFLRIDALLDGVATFPEHWKFLNSIEHGPMVFYDIREDDLFSGYQLGLAFSLNPVQ